jgi:hypothetical protein
MRFLKWAAAILALVSILLGGCGSPNARLASEIATGAGLGLRSPTHDLEQIYYLGVFDPREQIPETIYRVIVKGQSSGLWGLRTKYASGWVPAGLVDSLNSKVWVDPKTNDAPTVTPGTNATPTSALTSRRLVLFGPEGFREAPRDHRLVIVMGQSPEAFFNAVDSALGQIAGVRIERANAGLQTDLFQRLLAIKEEQSQFQQMETDLAKTFPAK